VSQPPPLIALCARVLTFSDEGKRDAFSSSQPYSRAVARAGGVPVLVPPIRELASNARSVLRHFDGVLLPGGGDVDPARYGGEAHPSVYDVDAEQDSFDLAVAEWAFATGRPVLAICRGLQIVNVARSGTLVTDMVTPHRHVVSELDLRDDSRLRSATDVSTMTISCFHHQALRAIGDGLRATAWAEDGTIEAVELAADDEQWFLGLQWHPEDTAAADDRQAQIFRAFVAAAAQFADRSERRYPRVGRGNHPSRW
jgi:putative glutamine amidotransferase